MMKMATTNDPEAPDHAEVVAFLEDPASYPGSIGSVEIKETHAAMVFLAGQEVFKIKKPVLLPYLDFSSLEKRRAACEYELEINQPHAPMIYLDVVNITREANGGLAINGSGNPVECALHMRRFPDNSLLADLVRDGCIKAEFMDCLADEIGRYHAAAPVVQDICAADRMSAIVDELCGAFQQAKGLLPSTQVEFFEHAARLALKDCGHLLNQRGGTGNVRRCHGDLHLSNIVAIDGQPVLFDAIEFNDDIATVDVLYDLAFLLMDLGHCNEISHANRILNRYLSRSGNDGHLAGLQAMPLFMSCRAGVRAMVGITRLQQTSAAGQPADAGVDARSYLLEATNFLQPQPPRLVAVGGLSGTGKTSVARALAPGIVRCPGALHLRTDVERKTMFGVGETTRLPADSYTREISNEVYGVVFKKATAALQAGHTVIVDAVFLDQAERSAIEKVAENAGASFAGLWLKADEDVLVQRVSNRQGDASDATADVVRRQSKRPAGLISWQNIDAGGGLEKTVERSLHAL